MLRRFGSFVEADLARRGDPHTLQPGADREPMVQGEALLNSMAWTKLVEVPVTQYIHLRGARLHATLLLIQSSARESCWVIGDVGDDDVPTCSVDDVGVHLECREAFPFLVFRVPQILNSGVAGLGDGPPLVESAHP
ncbi:unnamed protein product [Sphagnum balticum]